MKFINESRCCHTSYKEVKVPEICNLKNCICDECGKSCDVILGYE